MILFCSLLNFNNYFVHAMHKIAQFTFANSTFEYFPEDQKHSQFDVPCNKDVVHEDVQLCAFLLKTTSPRRLWKSQMDYLQLSLYSVRNTLEWNENMKQSNLNMILKLMTKLLTTCIGIR